MLDIGSFTSVTAIGIAVIAVDAYLIRRHGETYLEGAYSDPRSADSLNRMITTLFSLSMLGILALLSVAGTGSGGFPDVVTRLGVLLLITAAAHGIVLALLTRTRRRQREQRINAEVAMQTRAPGASAARPPTGRSTPDSSADRV
ncbi:hypothetical protein IQ251_05110 [Saccharopolyspora sp. HNM0983]|uniref:Uncharacterized protein n=1 Tax=Saccharopolyspora montiporae TaxID=2781240 RepID=A0A929B8L0_9PSEU|nr:hypothetical protein [Saccharopolyspora sp. HNM0983]MBE9373825.1 hypothetical protein [Saccharopolyspora sp. HNM0983]